MKILLVITIIILLDVLYFESKNVNVRNEKPNITIIKYNSIIGSGSPAVTRSLGKPMKRISNLGVSHF